MIRKQVSGPVASFHVFRGSSRQGFEPPTPASEARAQVVLFLKNH
jgi:hypothetical protein